MSAQMKKAAIRCREMGSKVALGTSATILAFPALALDESAETAITSAFTSATGSINMTVVGVIGLVALVCGAGIIVSWLKKG